MIYFVHICKKEDLYSNICNNEELTHIALCRYQCSFVNDETNEDTSSAQNPKKQPPSQPPHPQAPSCTLTHKQ